MQREHTGAANDRLVELAGARCGRACVTDNHASDAIWFLFLGFLTFMATAVYAAILRSPERTATGLATGTSIGVGLLVGPVVYLSLAGVT